MLGSQKKKRPNDSQVLGTVPGINPCPPDCPSCKVRKLHHWAATPSKLSSSSIRVLICGYLINIQAFFSMSQNRATPKTVMFSSLKFVIQSHIEEKIASL